MAKYIYEEIRKAARKQIIYTEHAITEINSESEIISCEETMKCLYCAGQMKKTKIGYSINRKDYHLYLEEVPAYVCIKCKEKLFEEQEVAAIQKLIKRLESDVRQLQMA